MKLAKTVTRASLLPFARVSLLLLQILSILQIPARTNGSVLSNKVVPICEEGCHCFGSEGNCPSYPTITESMLPTYRTLIHTNPMEIRCDPFQSTSCVSTLELGEACVVDLIASNTTTESSCPNGYSYRLRTVPSLESATAGRQYITHTGACGACSSLQDLALMIEYPNIPYKAQQCFFRSTALKFIDEAITCYEEIGFTPACSTTLAYHQRRIVEKNCGYQCAAWGYDGGKPSCEDLSGCETCVDQLGISSRLELVAGRTFANSGYPSQKAQQCSDITSVDVIGGSDICSEAPLEQSPTEVPDISAVPSMTPVVQMTASPTKELTQLPTMAPLPLATAVPTNTPTTSPVEPTKQPTEIPSTSPIEPTNSPTAPIEITEKPVSIITALPTPAPVPLAAPPLSYQQCLSTAAIEIRVGALSGGNGVICDCSEAENGETNRPRCFSSPDRDDSSRCVIQNEACGPDDTCCSDNVRSCRGGFCRSSGGRVNRNSYRLSGSRGGAARNDRSASTFSDGNRGTRQRGRIRGRA